MAEDNTMSGREMVQKVLEYYRENEDDFNNDIELLDDIIDILGDDRCYPMHKLDEVLGDIKISEFVDRINYFDKDDPYFCKTDGWIYSQSYKDYMDYLDEQFVDDLYNAYVQSGPNPFNITSEVEYLFAEYKKFEEQN